MKLNHQNKLFTYWIYDNREDSWVPLSGISKEGIFTERVKQDRVIDCPLRFKIIKWPYYNKVLIGHYPQGMESGVEWEIAYYYLTGEEYLEITARE